MQIDWQKISFIIAAVSAIIAVATATIRYGAKGVSFFTRMDTKLDNTHADVKVILHNHIPHLYERLGERGYEVREYSFSHARGSRKDRLPVRLDTNEPRALNGGDEGSVEDGERD